MNLTDSQSALSENYSSRFPAKIIEAFDHAAESHYGHTNSATLAILIHVAADNGWNFDGYQDAYEKAMKYLRSRHDSSEPLGHFDSHGRFLGSPEPCDWAGVPLADRAALAVFTENLDGKGSLMPDVGRCSECGRGTMFRSSLGTVCGFPEGEEKCPGILVPLNWANRK